MKTAVSLLFVLSGCTFSFAQTVQAVPVQEWVKTYSQVSRWNELVGRWNGPYEEKNTFILNSSGSVTWEKGNGETEMYRSGELQIDNPEPGVVRRVYMLDGNIVIHIVENGDLILFPEDPALRMKFFN